MSRLREITSIYFNQLQYYVFGRNKKNKREQKCLAVKMQLNDVLLFNFGIVWKHL